MDCPDQSPALFKETTNGIGYYYMQSLIRQGISNQKAGMGLKVNLSQHLNTQTNLATKNHLMPIVDWLDEITGQGMARATTVCYCQTLEKTLHIQRCIVGSEQPTKGCHPIHCWI